jgi:NAD(P)-dependent dehydrogenase (short-subunit alcohol dehydrogenase family)
LALARQGAALALAARNQQKLEELAQRIASAGGKAAVFAIDVADEEKIKAGIKAAIAHFGKVDILVNNAGVNVGPEGRKLIHEFDDSEWARTVNIDLNGVYFTSKPIIKNMVENGYGRIINISSIVGEVPLRNQCAFTAAKAGVINLTKAMAIELAPFGILVNAICPGSIMFEGTRALFYADKQRAERMISHIPLGRPGEPKEIAGMTIMLSSDEISYMTGNIVTIDGGWICGFARDF